MNEPLKIPVGFAASGDKNTIPETTTTTGAASWAAGFPAITSVPVTQGGVSPARADFNGIFSALSLGLMWLQQGNHYSYDQGIDYNPGAIAAFSGALYFCKIVNGPGSSVVAPGSDPDVWGLLLGADGNSAISTTGGAEKDGSGNIITSTYATKTDDAAKLPLSGGTMTGNIKNYTSYAPFIARVKDNTATSGAYCDIFRVEKEDGSVILSRPRFSYNGETLFCDWLIGNGGPSLKLRSSGVFTWQEKTVECAVEKGTGYLKLSDGTQICWGDFNISSTTEYSKTINFTRAFSSAPVVALGGVGSGDVIANTSGRTATGCTVVIKNVAGTYAWNKHALYIAIGTGA